MLGESIGKKRTIGFLEKQNKNCNLKNTFNQYYATAKAKSLATLPPTYLYGMKTKSFKKKPLALVPETFENHRKMRVAIPV